MSVAAMPLAYRRLRAPRRDGDYLLDPPWTDVPGLLEQNRRLAGCGDSRPPPPDFASPDCQGRSLRQLATSLRAELLTRARDFVSQYQTVGPLPDPAGPIIASGHQPWLFHPGVWFKNFALGRLAASTGGVGVNLIVDNDLCPRPSLRVPSGSPDAPHVENVILDAVPDEARYDDMPFEERRIADYGLLDSFATRVGQAIARFVPRPLIHELWPDAMRAARRTNNLGRCLAEARHQLEACWGVSTWELPLSEACRAEAFCWFTAHLLANLPRLWEIHNASLAEFRAVHQLRSRSHPVPDLAAADDWLEAPFWVWTRSSPRRRRLFARQVGEQVELTDRAGWTTRLAVTAESDADRACEQLMELASGDVRIRPRALMTTLAVRLLMSDLFLHGIGGAKYDQLTDVILQRFFDIPAPRFLVLTATALLPIQRPAETPDDLRRVDRQLRKLRFNPEFFAAGRTGGANGDELAAEKRRLVAWSPPRGAGKQRHAAIQRVNERLRAVVQSQVDDCLVEREQILGRLRVASMLGSREYSFCLFPETSLRKLLLEFPAHRF